MLDLRTVERYVEDKFDLNRAVLTFRVGGEPLLEREFAREGSIPHEFTFDRDWAAGEHELSGEIRPLGDALPQERQLRIRLNGVTVKGPMAPEHWVAPKNYARFFPKAVPAELAERRAYAGELLGQFATRAFRRPVGLGVVDVTVTSCAIAPYRAPVGPAREATLRSTRGAPCPTSDTLSSR